MKKNNRKATVVGTALAKAILGKREYGEVGYYKRLSKVAHRIDYFIDTVLLFLIVVGGYAYIFGSALLRTGM